MNRKPAEPAIQETDELVRLRALAQRATEGPWLVGSDDAEDAEPHRNSGLALVETGRGGDWPISRLGEWHTARYIAACDPQTILSLLDRIESLTRAIEALTAERDQWLIKARDMTEAAVAWHRRATFLARVPAVKMALGSDHVQRCSCAICDIERSDMGAQAQRGG